MKYSIALFLALCTSSLWAQFPEQGLEAYYSFDNCSFFDTTSIIPADRGNVNISKIGKAICDPSGCGLGGGGSILFDGQDDQLIFLNSLSNIFSSGNFSLSFYLLPAYSPGIVNLFSKREIDCGDFHAFSISFNPASNMISVTISEDTGINGNVKAALDFDRCWQHVVVVREGSSTRLYINGTLRAEKQAPQIINLTSSVGLSIASSICEDRYAGNMDELFIYRVALKQRDINELYLNPDQINNRDTTVFLGSSIDINLSSTCADNFLWSPSAGVSDVNAAEPVLTPLQTTTYTLNMSGVNCEASDSIRITVLDPDQLDCSVVYLPKAFTPNNDGLNDNYGISNPYAIDNLLSFEIFDRWGSRVFYTENPFEGWDGSFHGQAMNPGVLLYRIRHICQDKELIEVGNLSIIR